MTTKAEEFQRDEAKRTILSQSLPVVLEALAALKDELESDRVNAGVANNDVGNSYFQQIVGARHLIKRLPDLTKEYRKPKAPAGRRLFTEADREYLKQREENV